MTYDKPFTNIPDKDKEKMLTTDPWGLAKALKQEVKNLTNRLEESPHKTAVLMALWNLEKSLRGNKSPIEHIMVYTDFMRKMAGK
ncbi:MAG: hypothetical protein Unbinned8472contig1000_81 [Prokaryotic dsDNA virus sp.]|nr:MAG: hypothetical protein Unbinned8472contig1000_81 [Prokaryotic dsDNA virus sp.]